MPSSTVVTFVYVNGNNVMPGNFQVCGEIATTGAQVDDDLFVGRIQERGDNLVCIWTR